MNAAPGNPESEPANPGRKRKRRQVSILLFCIMIATALWFLRALENTYETQINHPVRYTNLPDDYVLLHPLPNRLELDVEALGFSVLKHNWNFSKTPLTIDFKDIKPVMPRKKAGFRDTVSLNGFAKIFSESLGDISVTGIHPDFLILDLAPKPGVKKASGNSD
ncbi:MAG: hypothetical protein A2X22_05335 [Bacteroidetes bacterium GWF2_49_14]|nr:MAG: hypothetical protein A2X22_05335 [Bacteroidetes bacterium GWF2_49_14]HBB93612.1 hypothetical protein [Bacteroidales bacterium]